MKTKLQFSIILAVLFFLINETANAQVPDWRWAKSIAGADYKECNSMTLDDSGNVYTTGSFYGTVDFDPGAGIFNLTSAGGFDIFIDKLDSLGNFVWAKRIGSIGTDVAYSIALDVSGNVYTTGVFSLTVDFDPGSSGTFNLTSSGDQDPFISKLDNSGNFIWAKQLIGTNDHFITQNSIAIDPTGNVYIAGEFVETVDFDPGAGTFNLTSASANDIYILKLNGSGNFLWAKRIGGFQHDWVSSLTIDSSGNVYTTGEFMEKVDFNPGGGIFNLTSVGSYDIFILKLNKTGKFVWVKRIGGTGHDDGESIALDASGNVYTTGLFEGTADFDPGPTVYNLTSPGSYSCFISKLDSLGNFVWAKAMGGTSGIIGHSIVAASGNVYTSGAFGGTSDFNPAAGTFNITSSGNSDMFLAKLDSSGNFISAIAMGGTGNDGGKSIAVNNSGNVYVTGSFDSPSILFGSTTLTNAGSFDIFIAKLSGVDKPCSAITCSINPTLITTRVYKPGCNNGTIIVNLGGTFQAFPHIELYDSSQVIINSVNLTAGTQIYTFTDLIPGSYIVKVFDSNCCEQDLTANLQCIPPKTGLGTTNITATSATLNWGVVGCAVDYRLQYRVQGTSVWTTIGVLKNTGFSNITGLQPLSTYEWHVGKKCTGYTTAGVRFSPIQTFTTAALRAGEEAPDVSAMESFEINIKPNPALTSININFESEYSTASLKIVNITGQVVFEKKVYSSEGSYEEQLDVSGFNNGVYVLLVETANGVSRKKFAKQ